MKLCAISLIFSESTIYIKLQLRNSSIRLWIQINFDDPRVKGCFQDNPDFSTPPRNWLTKLRIHIDAQSIVERLYIYILSNQNPHLKNKLNFMSIEDVQALSQAHKIIDVLRGMVQPSKAKLEQK